MKSLLLAPLLSGYAVADPVELMGPTLAADLCVSMVAKGDFDDAALTAAGWSLDKDSGKGAFKDARLYMKKGTATAVTVEKAKSDGVKCTVMFFANADYFKAVEFQLAAHFNDRIFPLNAETIGYKVPGHKVAVFSTQKTLKEGAMLEIMAVPHDPKEPKK